MHGDELGLVVDRLRRQRTNDGAVEVKACRHELGSSVWESISAFANTAGGILILGLDESAGFQPVDDFELERVRDQLVSGTADSSGVWPTRPSTSSRAFSLRTPRFSLW